MKFNTNILKNIAKSSDKLKGTLSNKYSKFIIALIASAAILTFGFYTFYNPVSRFKSAIEKGNVEKAMEIYHDTDSINEITKVLKEYLADIEDEFNKGKISYESAKNKLEPLKKLTFSQTSISDSIASLDSLNKSKTAFSHAKESLAKNDILNTLDELSNVIEKDVNYNEAQNIINENKDLCKTEALSKSDALIKENNYKDAVQLLNTARIVLGNDSEIISKLEASKTELQKILDTEKAAELEKLKSEQLIVVTDTYLGIQDERFKSLYPDMLQAVVINNSQQTVKDMSIGFLAYDTNGYPLKIKGSIDFSDGSYEFSGKAENINLTHGSRYGSSTGWELDENHKVATIKACVKSATFYDGSTWSNPYYSKWLSEYKEKPLN